jgi:type IV pilus assembly protein PilC
VGAIGFYVIFLLPKMMEMLGPRMEKIPPLTAFTLEMSSWFKDNFIFLAGSILLLCFGFYIYISSPAGRLSMHKFLIRVPYFGRILRDTSIEIFCRVFGIMYTSSGENIDAIQIAGDASGNPYLAFQIRTVAIPLMLRFGVELGKAMQETGFFPEMVISRFKTGAETGNVKATALQVADYYQMENGYAMKNLANVIEMSVTVMITLSLVFLTYLSSETASVKIK